MHKCLFCACKSQDFGQSQTNFALSHELETVTFRNSGCHESQLCVVGHSSVSRVAALCYKSQLGVPSHSSVSQVTAQCHKSQLSVTSHSSVL